jgi:hypothetical protein
VKTVGTHEPTGLSGGSDEQWRRVADLVVRAQVSNDARFDEHDARFDRLDARFDRLEADVAVLKTDVAGLKTDVAVLKTDVSGLKITVDDLQGQITRMEVANERTAARHDMNFERLFAWIERDERRDDTGGETRN